MSRQSAGYSKRNTQAWWRTVRRLNEGASFGPGVTLLAIALAASPISAEEASTPRGFEEVLVTGTHAPGPQLTNSAVVLTAVEIQALRKRTVVELLQTLPGVLVEAQGGPGGLTAVSIRGGESNFTLVLLDGIPINDPTNTRGGSVDFANLSADLVERIEIVKGAQSAVYGSDALTGVINIITRSPASGHQLRARAAWGEDHYHELGATLSGLVEKGAESFDYVLEVQEAQSSRIRRNGVREGRRDNRNANIRLGWVGGNGHAVSANYRFLEGDRRSFPEQSGGPLLAVLDDLESSDFEQHTASLSWAFNPADYWASSLSVSRFEFEEVVASPGIVPFTEVPPLGSDSDFTRDQWRWVNTLQLATGLSLQMGVDLRDEKGSSEGFLEFFGALLPTDFSLSRRTHGAFALASYSASETLKLQASLRYDDPEDFSGETSASLGLEYEPIARLAFFANWGEAYKLPSFFALGHPLVGNPLLAPEKSTTWDAGVRWRAAPDLSIELASFYNDFEDLIDFDDAAFINVNRNEVESKGIEFQMLWQPQSPLRVRGQATYTDVEVINEESVLTGRPEWTAGLSTLWQISATMSAALDYRYVGKAWATSRHTGESVTQRLGDYHRVDLTLGWQPNPHWQVDLMLDNAMDESYQGAVGFPGPERAVRIGLRYAL